MQSEPIKASREFIEALARDAGDFARCERAGLQNSQIHAKATPADLVTDIDRRTEARIRDRIAAAFPEHGFFGEEFGQGDRTSPFCWVVDPIDGTTNYIHNHPAYAVSIALEYHGEPILAAVYAPRLGELFSAARHEGAFCNGERLRVSSCRTLSAALLAVGFACLRARREDNNLPVFNRIAPVATGVRRMGSAALDLAFVAAGRYDGYWEMELGRYDVAAGVLLVREAGGVVTDFHGGAEIPGDGIVAAGAALHGELLATIRDVRG